MTISENVAKKASIKSELEQTRQDFHKLLAATNPSDWDKPSGNAAWTVGEVFSHLADILNFYCGCIEKARQGKNAVPPIPHWLMNRLNIMDTRRKAKKVSYEDAGKKYEQGHAKLLKLLDTIQNNEWQSQTRSPLSPGGYLTVEAAFRAPVSHFAEHSRQITHNH